MTQSSGLFTFLAIFRLQSNNHQGIFNPLGESMKKLLFGFAFCTLALGIESAERPVAIGHVTASVNNIPIAYSSAAGSQILSNLASSSKFICLNDTAVDIMVSLGSGTNCVSGDFDNYIVPAGLGFEPNNAVAIKNVVCIRSLSGVIAAGDVWVSAY